MSRQRGVGGGLAGTAAVAGEIVDRVQVLGLASASAVAERCIATVDRYLADRDGPRTLDLPAVGGPAPGPQPAEALELPAVPAGSSTGGSLWIHNPTTAPVRARVRVSSLTSAEGHLLPAPTVGVPSSAGIEVAAGGSVEVRVQVRVPAGTPPGHFHGVVTSTATPRQCLPLLLHVRTSPAEDGP
ncbi:hypothetical protein [Ornithinimicrobium pekingense]|uniref:Uncharacterized protein n=1 Tax=Ornithinimicrobium pekingense TaxID=384677 RepID=A0ABQ2F9X4_9MICO|nr:hypothetical protein [Ornithinimicrobium pekingense]GGK75141.1 hypothetical protein GCM10011509_24770 [Ornithinimicrobium pekingense]